MPRRYGSPALKSLGYSSQDIISHNFAVSIVHFFSNALFVWLVTFIHPLKILSFRSKFTFLLILLLPILINHCTSSFHIFFVQFLLAMAKGGAVPGDAVFTKSIPVGKRFTVITLSYAASRAVIYIISAFGLVYLTEWIGSWGVWVIGLPVAVGYVWCIYHFEKLEGLRPNKSDSKRRDELIQDQAA